MIAGALTVITFTKICLPYGWLGNMSRHPIRYDGDRYPTCETLFQALRFNDAVLRREIREQTSPMRAKWCAMKHGPLMVVVPRGEQDVENMRIVLALKIARHPDLHALLLATGDARIVEDCSRRRGESGRFWGAVWQDGAWQGRNTLGALWMELRSDLNGRARLPETQPER